MQRCSFEGAMEDAQLREKHEAALAWFSQFQLDCVIRNGIIPEWFHGIISRKTAEEMLLSKPAGYFLIRVSESRIGYTLSYRAEDRCRHFMIDVLRNGQYTIVGENTSHRSLQDLVAFHRRVPILPFNELLTVACGQVSKDKADYAELLFPKKNHFDPIPGAVANNGPHISNAPHLELPSATPPALPNRPAVSDSGHSVASTAVPTPCYPHRLYPSLDTELATLTLQTPSMMNTVKPVPLPRKKLNPPSTVESDPQPPELPARGILPQRREHPNTGPNQLSGSRLECTETPSTQPSLDCGTPNNNQHRGQSMKSAVVSLMQFKRKSHKKNRASEEHTYSELSELSVESETAEDQQSLKALVSRPSDLHKACENVYQELPGESQIGKPSTGVMCSFTIPASVEGLPAEYLNPPPFAPGY
ncbi:hypothetical protein MATL_G00028780 [Megalops atlanticus]|uniref:SH2 domain-containing protein n=1 Tax=Megalops atlanticus TaxID=7932 RepID=A0A9D3TCT0_MEGAT|nr:hypothetical protein MATL_G00028780 [Megalops atlanticus]